MRLSRLTGTINIGTALADIMNPFTGGKCLRGLIEDLCDRRGGLRICRHFGDQGELVKHGFAQS